MRQEPVETLESAGDRWKGGIDWSDDWERWVRHWWRRHPTEPILMHRASGEQVVHVGELGEPNWHRFEYRHGETIYPLAVEMKRAPWPNPHPNRYVGPPYDGSPMPELYLHVWRIDHPRSAELWRCEDVLKGGSDQPPPYWLWRRVDQAITDAALLWPSVFRSEIRAADDVAVNGGWLNGAWRVDFFRRMRRRRDFRRYRPTSSSGLSEISGWPLPRSMKDIGLPLSDYHLEELEAPVPGWKATGAGGNSPRDGNSDEHWVMRNQLDGSTLGVNVHAADQNGEHEKVVVVQRDSIAWLLPILGGAAHSTVCLDGPCSIALPSATPDRVRVPWLGKQVLAFDGIRRNSVPAYDPNLINHPLASYQSWRFLYDGLLNALLFFPEFAENPSDAYEVNIVGGFVGGAQGLVTEARLKLDLPSDKENETWSKFFS